MTQEQTKEVQGTFGPKQVTRDEFIKQWRDHLGQFFYLADSYDDLEELNKFGERIKEMAGKRWDKIK